MANGIIYQAGPASLFASMARANETDIMCTCLEIEGDDVNCRVHGTSSDSTLPPKDERDVEEKKGWC